MFETEDAFAEIMADVTAKLERLTPEQHARLNGLVVRCRILRLNQRWVDSWRAHVVLRSENIDNALAAFESSLKSQIEKRKLTGHDILC